MRDLPQSGRRLCVTSCNYLPRWSIWPVGSFGIYRPWKHQTQTLELCHLLASNSEIRICVAPSIEISLDSNTQTSSFWSFVVPKAPMLSWSSEALCNRMHGWWCFKAGKLDVKKTPKLPKATQKLEVSWLHFLVEDAMWPMSLKRIWNSKWEISPSLAEVCVCDQLQLFAEMKYLASRQLWNLQTLKTPDTNSRVVPSTRFKFRNRDLRCTMHRKKPRLQYTDQQFLKFRCSKGTNAELKLRSTLQQNAGLVVL